MTRGTSRPAVAHLRRARDLVDRDFAEPLDLGAMAAAAGFSRFHFARAFRAAYGETPAAYLTRRRVERAKDLLRSANLTVTEICHLVGFTSLGSFSSRFTELVGLSPTAYRDEHVRRGGPPPIPGCFLMSWTRPPTPPAPDTASTEKPPARARTYGSPERPAEEGTP
ncbi:helix-turn-helix transcriptional regulator [Pseudonocardia lutea]|jgi:AraC-like DNA-binding protein|uniref:Helix-turn-helix transcriptional regulator n=1 Tax=Pseudonocardia lutea TaxID=2172015 RepID=A0ABW1IC60_9PSEU